MAWHTGGNAETTAPGPSLSWDSSFVLGQSLERRKAGMSPDTFPPAWGPPPSLRQGWTLQCACSAPSTQVAEPNRILQKNTSFQLFFFFLLWGTSVLYRGRLERRKSTLNLPHPLLNKHFQRSHIKVPSGSQCSGYLGLFSPGLGAHFALSPASQCDPCWLLCPLRAETLAPGMGQCRLTSSSGFRTGMSFFINPCLRICFYRFFFF